MEEMSVITWVSALGWVLLWIGQGVIVWYLMSVANTTDDE